MLFTEHDILHIHKILGFGCLTHYAYRMTCRILYNNMLFHEQPLIAYLTPAVHLTLSLSSFMFQVPKYRFNSKVIIWKELQLHNIIFTSRSVFVMYHIMLGDNHPYYHHIRLAIVMTHHLMADIVSKYYQVEDKTTTRDIPYDTNNTIIPYLYKKYYAISQLAATASLLFSKNMDNAFIIMFPIQLSTFLMTLVRKKIITNNQWHIFYALSLAAPYLVNYNAITPNNDKFYATILMIISRLVLKVEKYTNMITMMFIYNAFYAI